MTNPEAAILVIGDEILSGRTRDKNINWLAEELTKRGIALKQARIIPDHKQAIMSNVKELSAAYDFVFTTGGIGPTHDDITTEAMAQAFGVPVIRHLEAEARLIHHYKDSDITFNQARQKMADIPKGAELIDNPVSAAPGYKIGNVYIMAGVPAIFQAMFITIADSLKGGIQPTRITIQCAIGEGSIAEIMQNVADDFPDLSVGSYPWFKAGQYGTAVVLTGLSAPLVSDAANLLTKHVTEAGFGAYHDLENSNSGE